MSAAGDRLTVKFMAVVPESPSSTRTSATAKAELASSSVTVTETLPVTEP